MAGCMGLTVASHQLRKRALQSAGAGLHGKGKVVELCVATVSAGDSWRTRWQAAAADQRDRSLVQSEFVWVSCIVG